jgi:hypothetical protein
MIPLLLLFWEESEVSKMQARQLLALTLIIVITVVVAVWLLLGIKQRSAEGRATVMELSENLVACDYMSLYRDRSCVETSDLDDALICEAASAAEVTYNPGGRGTKCYSASEVPPLQTDTTEGGTTVVGGSLTPSGGHSILLPVAALLMGTGVLTYAVLRYRV